MLPNVASAVINLSYGSRINTSVQKCVSVYLCVCDCAFAHLPVHLMHMLLAFCHRCLHIQGINVCVCVFVFFVMYI